MMPRRNAVSLVELLVGLVLIGLVILGLSNIEMFSRSVFFNTDRRIKLQNDVSLVLQHMQKFVAMGISNETQQALNFSVIEGAPSAGALQVWIDSNATGTLDGTDTLIAYVYNSTQKKVFSYPDYLDTPASKELLAANIELFQVAKSANNTVRVNITGRVKADGSAPSRDNPRVNLTTVIILPSVASD